MSDNPDQNGFPRRLRNLRTRLCWSQEDLANQSGVSRKTIWNWEHGVTPRVTSKPIRRVAEVLRVTPGALIYGEENDGDA